MKISSFELSFSPFAIPLFLVHYSLREDPADSNEPALVIFAERCDGNAHRFPGSRMNEMERIVLVGNYQTHMAYMPLCRVGSRK